MINLNHTHVHAHAHAHTHTNTRHPIDRITHMIIVVVYADAAAARDGPPAGHCAAATAARVPASATGDV